MTMKAAVAALVALVGLTLVGCSRDEESYQYGANQISVSAGMLLRASQNLPGTKSYNNPGEACRIAVETLPASTLEKLDHDDMIDGCTDALK